MIRKLNSKQVPIFLLILVLLGCASEEKRVAQRNEDIMLKEKLGVAESLFKQAKNEGAEIWAPKTFAYTEDTIKAAKSLIRNNPSAAGDIDKKSTEASFEAKRLVNLTKQSKYFAKLKPEEVALWSEAKLRMIGDAAGAPDTRDEALDAQVASIKQAVGSLIASKQQLANRTQSLKDETENMQRKVSSLSKEAKEAEQLREKDARFAKVSAAFAPNEAEVYRQGEKLFIRLKGIQFPSGQARLGGQNFALLTKVHQALEDYPRAPITVEGHTDSVGSKEFNEKISLARAEAVRQYLISIGVDEEEVAAVGMGSEKPIASNQSTKGRAMNRRIDVIIDDSQPSVTAE